jgi:hypothetical protein
MLYCYVDEDSFPYLYSLEFHFIFSEIDESIVCLSVCPSLLGFLVRISNSKLVYDSFRLDLYAK